MTDVLDYPTLRKHARLARRLPSPHNSASQRVVTSSFAYAKVSFSHNFHSRSFNISLLTPFSFSNLFVRSFVAGSLHYFFNTSTTPAVYVEGTLTEGSAATVDRQIAILVWLLPIAHKRGEMLGAMRDVLCKMRPMTTYR